MDPEQYLNFTNVKLSMGGIDRSGQGNFSFTSPVNLSFVKDHFWELFDVYVRNVSYKELNRTMNVKDFKITRMENDTTIFFNITFFEPYKLGLLKKRPDRLHIQLKYDLLDTKGYFRAGKYAHL